MGIKLKVDVQNENFDKFFAQSVAKLSESEIQDLPLELQHKVFRSNKTVDEENTSKLKFIEKLYTLFKSCKKRWYIIVENEEEGINLEQLQEFKKSIKKRDLSISNAEKLVSFGDFVLGSKELVDAIAFRNHLSVSPAYRYALKGKNTETDFSEFKKCALYFTKLLCNYEGNKKRMVMQRGLKMPEFYILLYFYDGIKKKGSDVYNSAFKYSYNSSKSQINTGLTKLKNLGMLTKHGAVRHTEYSITALGVETVNNLIKKYILDF